MYWLAKHSHAGSNIKVINQYLKKELCVFKFSIDEVHKGWHVYTFNQMVNVKILQSVIEDTHK